MSFCNPPGLVFEVFEMKNNPDFVLRELYGKALLMPIRTNEASDDPVSLNPVAVVIWKTAETADDKADMLRKVSDYFELEAGSAEQMAVESFINQLLDMKLIYE